jgi:hypothetical protein
MHGFQRCCSLAVEMTDDAEYDEYDITGIMSAITTSRRQSVSEVLADMERFDVGDAMEAFDRSCLEKMRWEEVLPVLQLLPRLLTPGEPVFQLRARMVTELGMLFYAVTCDPLDQQNWLFAGVHCFPNEAFDLERRGGFVLMPYDGIAAIIPSEVFEAAMDPSATGSVYLLHVYDIQIEGRASA